MFIEFSFWTISERASIVESLSLLYLKLNIKYILGKNEKNI